jgi:hypothetical protein
MRRHGVSEDGGGGVPVRAIVAGLVALYGAALTVGVAGGVPSGRSHGRAGAASASVGGRDPAPVARLSFGGPGGELLGLAAVGGPREVRAP